MLVLIKTGIMDSAKQNKVVKYVESGEEGVALIAEIGDTLVFHQDAKGRSVDSYARMLREKFKTNFRIVTIDVPTKFRDTQDWRRTSMIL